MYGVDHSGILNEFLNNPAYKIPKAHLDSVCKKSSGKMTCKYISLGPSGFICAKMTKMKEILDAKAKDGLMVAQSDNCEGIG
jgi:hypothetical protein